MKNKIDYKKLTGVVFSGVILYCVLQNHKMVFEVLEYMFNLIFPFLLGGAIAFVLNVPMSSIEGKLFPNAKKFDPFRRVCAYLITLILIVGVISLALFVIIPQLSDTIKLIAKRIPGAVSDFKDWLYVSTASIPNAQSYIEQINIDWSSVSSQVIDFVKNTGSKFFSSGLSFVSNVIGGLATALIAFIFSIYVILQKETLGRQAKKIIYGLFSVEKSDKIVEVTRLSKKVFSNFIYGQCIEAVILGTMFFITLLLFKLPYAMLISVVITISALIPIFGAFIGLAIGALLIVMVDPMKALWFIIIFFVLQQIEGNLIYPKVVGNSIGLPSIWVLVAVSIGGSLMGIAGILIFIPLCSVGYALFSEFINKKLKKKNIPVEKWETKKAVGKEEDGKTEESKNKDSNEESNKEESNNKDSNEAENPNNEEK